MRTYAVNHRLSADTSLQLEWLDPVTSSVSRVNAAGSAVANTADIRDKVVMAGVKHGF